MHPQLGMLLKFVLLLPEDDRLARSRPFQQRAQLQMQLLELSSINHISASFQLWETRSQRAQLGLACYCRLEPGRTDRRHWRSVEPVPTGTEGERSVTNEPRLWATTLVASPLLGEQQQKNEERKEEAIRNHVS